MDESSPVLAHQPKVVSELAKNFDRIYVITGSTTNCAGSRNILVKSVRWGEFPRIVSLFLLYIYLINYLLKERGAVFTHMNDAFAAFAAPVIWVSRTPHYLWYAHANKSKFIQVAKPFLTKIISSTPGSCPYDGSKVEFIGQGIDIKEFARAMERPLKPFNKGFHYGRFDSSKRIHVLFEESIVIRDLNRSFTFAQIGTPSSEKNKEYFEAIKSRYKDYFGDVFTIHPFVLRNEIPELVVGFDVFLHAYIGSLDKTLIETTLLEIPVLTENEEYLKLFGTWGSSPSKRISDQYEALIKMADIEIESELSKRRYFFLENYSLSAWTHRLVSVLDLP